MYAATDGPISYDNNHHDRGLAVRFYRPRSVWVLNILIKSVRCTETNRGSSRKRTDGIDTGTWGTRKEAAEYCCGALCDRGWEMKTARAPRARYLRDDGPVWNENWRFCNPLTFFSVFPSARVPLWSRCVFNDCFCPFVMRRTTKTPVGFAIGGMRKNKRNAHRRTARQ